MLFILSIINLVIALQPRRLFISFPQGKETGSKEKLPSAFQSYSARSRAKRNELANAQTAFRSRRPLCRSASRFCTEDGICDRPSLVWSTIPYVYRSTGPYAEWGTGPYVFMPT